LIHAIQRVLRQIHALYTQVQGIAVYQLVLEGLGLHAPKLAIQCIRQDKINKDSSMRTLLEFFPFFQKNEDHLFVKNICYGMVLMNEIVNGDKSTRD